MAGLVRLRLRLLGLGLAAVWMQEAHVPLLAGPSEMLLLGCVLALGRQLNVVVVR